MYVLNYICKYRFITLVYEPLLDHFTTCSLRISTVIKWNKAVMEPLHMSVLGGCCGEGGGGVLKEVKLKGYESCYIPTLDFKEYGQRFESSPADKHSALRPLLRKPGAKIFVNKH